MTYGAGTIINVLAIAAGSGAGLLIKGGLPEKVKDNIMKALGLATIFISITGVITAMITTDPGTGKLTANHTMLVIASLAVGAIIGEFLNIESGLDRLGDRLRKLFVRGGSDAEGHRFTEGFVAASLLFCVGAMAIVGSLEDGIRGNASILLTKSILDGVAAMIFTSTFGIGVIFSAVSVGIYQGSITLAAKAISPFLDGVLVSQISAVGSVLIFAIGVNMVFGKQFKTGNLLPAILIPPVYSALVFLWGGLLT